MKKFKKISSQQNFISLYIVLRIHIFYRVILKSKSYAYSLRMWLTRFKRRNNNIIVLHNTGLCFLLRQRWIERLSIYETYYTTCIRHSTSDYCYKTCGQFVLLRKLAHISCSVPQDGVLNRYYFLSVNGNMIDCWRCLGPEWIRLRQDFLRRTCPESDSSCPEARFCELISRTVYQDNAEDASVFTAI